MSWRRYAPVQPAGRRRTVTNQADGRNVRRRWFYVMNVWRLVDTTYQYVCYNESDRRRGTADVSDYRQCIYMKRIYVIM